MPKHTIDELRDILFDSLQAVKDGTMPLDRAKSVVELSQTVINSAKVEVDHLRVTGENGYSQFLTPSEDDEPESLPAPNPAQTDVKPTPELPNGKSQSYRAANGGRRTVTSVPGATITRNRMA